VKARLKSANGAQVQRKKVEEKSTVSLCGQRDHLALLLLPGFIEDVLQVRGLAAQTSAVVDNLAIDFASGKIDETQDPSSHSVSWRGVPRASVCP